MKARRKGEGDLKEGEGQRGEGGLRKAKEAEGLRGEEARQREKEEEGPTGEAVHRTRKVAGGLREEEVLKGEEGLKEGEVLQRGKGERLLGEEVRRRGKEGRLQVGEGLRGEGGLRRGEGGLRAGEGLKEAEGLRGEGAHQTKREERAHQTMAHCWHHKQWVAEKMESLSVLRWVVHSGWMQRMARTPIRFHLCESAPRYSFFVH